MRRNVVRLLRAAGLDAVAVENPAHPGTPDVECVGGWIELKYLPAWPPRNGALRIPHFTRQQRIWLKRRWQAGGGAYLLLQVGTDWMLFDGETASYCVGYARRDELISLSLHSWDSWSMLQEQLPDAIGRRRP